MAALQPNNVRKAYLITYSKADLERFDRESLARAVIRAFEAVATAFIVQWACCMEQHKDEGVHFHMCVLLSKLQRWSMVKKYLQEFENVLIVLIFLSYVPIVSIILFLKEFKFSQTILLVIASCLSFRFTLWKKFSMGFRSGDLGGIFTTSAPMFFNASFAFPLFWLVKSLLVLQNFSTARKSGNIS